MKFIIKHLIICVAFAAALLVAPQTVYACNDCGNPYYQTTANLRLRTGPTLDDEIIRTVPNGSTVRVYDYRCGEWFQVSVNGTNGYMNAEFLTKIVTEEPEASYEPVAPDYPAEAYESAEAADEPEVQDETEAYEPMEPEQPEEPYQPEPTVNTYGVELLNWQTVRNNILINGSPIHITDVRTGITFYLQPFSQGSHADVVPITHADTEALRRAFGGRWS